MEPDCADCPLHVDMEHRIQRLEKEMSETRTEQVNLAKALEHLKGWIAGGIAAAGALGALIGIAARMMGK